MTPTVSTTSGTTSATTTVSPGPGEMKNYYVRMEINNYGNKDINIKYTENWEDRETAVQKRSSITINMIIPSVIPPEAIVFRAFEAGTTNVVLMNEEESIEVLPDLQDRKTIANIGMLNKIQYLFECQ